MSSKVRTGCAMLIFVALSMLVAASVIWILVSRSIPVESPLARMYRTEAALAALKKAIETYRSDLGAYPPAGYAGLQLATDHLSRKVNYMPGGPPADGWDHIFRYVPNDQYEERSAEALRSDNGFAEPDAYQLYSIGADGDAGVDNADAQRDNINSWDPGRTWRNTYDAQQAEFMRDLKSRKQP